MITNTSYLVRNRNIPIDGASGIRRGGTSVHSLEQAQVNEDTETREQDEQILQSVNEDLQGKVFS